MGRHLHVPLASGMCVCVCPEWVSTVYCEWASTYKLIMIGESKLESAGRTGHQACVVQHQGSVRSMCHRGWRLGPIESSAATDVVHDSPVANRGASEKSQALDLGPVLPETQPTSNVPQALGRSGGDVMCQEIDTVVWKPRTCAKVACTFMAGEPCMHADALCTDPGFHPF